MLLIVEITNGACPQYLKIASRLHSLKAGKVQAYLYLHMLNILGVFMYESSKGIFVLCFANKYDEVRKKSLMTIQKDKKEEAGNEAKSAFFIKVMMELLAKCYPLVSRCNG